MAQGQVNEQTDESTRDTHWKIKDWHCRGEKSLHSTEIKGWGIDYRRT